MSKSNKKSKPLPLSKILQNQGFGTRNYCSALIEAGDVKVKTEQMDEICLEPEQSFATEGLCWEIGGDGVTWRYREFVYILVNKPEGYECSQKPSHHPSLMGLLPSQFRLRDIQSVGRLDVDTTGLLLMTDDGRFIHQLSSPKKRVPKIYHVTTKHPLTDEMLSNLTQGVLLHDSDEIITADSVKRLDHDCSLELTITQGKYHQVKRMIASIGNRVEKLHRHQIGALVLPNHIGPGQWCFIDEHLNIETFAQPS